MRETWIAKVQSLDHHFHSQLIPLLSAEKTTLRNWFIVYSIFLPSVQSLRKLFFSFCCRLNFLSFFLFFDKTVFFSIVFISFDFCRKLPKKKKKEREDFVHVLVLKSSRYIRLRAFGFWVFDCEWIETFIACFLSINGISTGISLNSIFSIFVNQEFYPFWFPYSVIQWI